MTFPKLNPLWITAAATTACAAVGSLASDPDNAFYRPLDKPSWNPPKVVFPIVWTTLYADIAVTTAAALKQLRERDPDEATRYATAFGTNLVLNAGWSYVFFRSKNVGLSAVWAAALALSSADLVRRTGSANRTAGVALAPYALWTSFAAALSTEIWRRNR